MSTHSWSRTGQTRALQGAPYTSPAWNGRGKLLLRGTLTRMLPLTPPATRFCPQADLVNWAVSSAPPTPAGPAPPAPPCWVKPCAFSQGPGGGSATSPSRSSANVPACREEERKPQPPSQPPSTAQLSPLAPPPPTSWASSGAQRDWPPSRPPSSSGTSRPKGSAPVGTTWRLRQSCASQT